MLKPDEPYKLVDGDATICGRLLAAGRLRLITPLIIGGGSSLYGDSDIVVLKDMQGQPYIPSSSITGALKGDFNNYSYKGSVDQDKYKQNKLWFWGGEDTFKKNDEKVRRSCQSALMISDLVLPEGSTAQLSIRDGIRINRSTGIVEPGAKYDFEIVEPGIAFNFRMEVIVRKAFNPELFNSFFDWIVYQLSQGKIALGARTNKGFGRCRLENISSYRYDYQDRDHIIAWLTEDEEKVKQPAGDFSQVDKLFKKETRQFSIKADFRIKNSLIVGSYSGDPSASDKVHLNSYDSEDSTKEVAVLPGTSIRGAIRSHAERIINTLGGDGNEMLKGLFGWVDTEKPDNGRNEAIKGRIKIEEKPITLNTFMEEIQYRIKIDRFTGGVINNALFDSMPIWAGQGDESMVTLELDIDRYLDWEAGLMLLVLKDLWNGDLAVGGEKNVGRGTLLGQRATICLDDQTIVIKKETEGLTFQNEDGSTGWDEETVEKLENLVKELHKKINEPGAKQGNEVLSDAE
jgi:CRISPR/Cas system CSM-associated protein Csm3 (group 7 of RAMP superfamily)